MEGGCALTGLACLAFLFGACGGGDGGIGASSTVATHALGASEDALLVVRYDLDRDGHLDVLTLDVTASTMQVVEALQGRGDGRLVDATTSWAGRRVPAELARVLRTYRSRSYAVASETELDLLLDGEPVFLSVLE